MRNYFLFVGITSHLHRNVSNLTPCPVIFLSSFTHMGRLQITSSQKLHYEKRQQERLLWKCLDWFQEQTKDEDKRPDRRAVLVNTRDKKLALIQPTGRAAIGKSLLIVKLNQELTNRIMRLKTSTAPVKLSQRRHCLLVSFHVCPIKGNLKY